MISGYSKTFDEGYIESLELDEKNILFILTGGGAIGERCITAGQGICLSGIGAADFSPNRESGARCLILKLDEEEERRFASLRTNSLFAFSNFDLLSKMANCFFAEETTYDNAILCRGITDIILSFITPHDSESKSENYIEKTERYIAENLHLPIKIDDIAEWLGISRGYLRNVFYKNRGMSPQEYLMKARMDRAKELLSCTSQSVTEVAFEIGYPDVLGFSRIFKKHTGFSPSAYRKAFAVSDDKAEYSRDITISVPAAKKTDAKKEIFEEKSAENEPVLDTIEALALEIEKAAAAEREKEEKKAVTTPPPFWLL